MIPKKGRYALALGSGADKEFDDFRIAVFRGVVERAVLHAAGVYVPFPYEVTDNVILMEYIGDTTEPAPTLAQSSLSAEEARAAFDTVMQEIRVCFDHGKVHADFSAYNILYWKHAITLIDFPQAVDPERNMNAFGLLLRDIENITQYFRRYGIVCDAMDHALTIWHRRY